MKVTITFELDSSWDCYKDCNPELLVDDMDVIHNDGIKIDKIVVEDNP